MKLAGNQDSHEYKMSLQLGHIQLFTLLLIAEKAQIWPSWHAGSQVNDRFLLGYLLVFYFIGSW